MMKNKERIEALEISRSRQTEFINDLRIRLDVLEADKAVDQLLGDSGRDELTELRRMKEKLEDYVKGLSESLADNITSVNISPLLHNLKDILEP